MQKINEENFIDSSIELLSVLRIQDRISPFIEKPSDKFGIPRAELDPDIIINNRKNPFELFALFTGDIIKEKVVYTR